MRNLAAKFVLAAVSICIPVFGQTAFVYAVHGIPGTALGGATTDLPVDVAIDGSCVTALTGFNFGEIRGPLPLPAPATYTVEVKAANTLTPCANPTLLSTSVAATPGANASIVAHLTAAGDPILSVFLNDVSWPGPGQGRIVLHHTAEAPAVDVNVYRGSGRGRSPAAPIPGFSNGTQVAATFNPGNWSATLSVDGSVVFGPTTVQLKPNTVQLIYAIGTFPESFTLVTKEIPAKR